MIFKYFLIQKNFLAFNKKLQMIFTSSVTQLVGKDQIRSIAS